MTTTDLPLSVDRAALRAWFPSLASRTAFLENAGGSQVPGVVAGAMATYMTSAYVQLEAGYPESDLADAVVHGAHAFIERLMGGEREGRVALGPSTSQLVAMLAGALAARIEPGDEIVVAQAGHEANVGPWVRLAEQRGATLRWWRVDPTSGAASLDELQALLNSRTKVVAIVHVSNLLGEIVDVAGAAARVHAHSPARLVVDGVAYAPHRAIDVEGWGVDWYVYSTYKVYGPHMAALWGRHEAWAELEGPYHFFIPRTEVPYAYEVGGVNHEGCAGLLALAPYLAGLAAMARGKPMPEPPGLYGQCPDPKKHLGWADRVPPPPLDVPALVAGAAALTRAEVQDAFALMAASERPLQRRLLEWLATRDGVRVIGPRSDGPQRVGTVAFAAEGRSSVAIARAVHAHGVAIRNGHNYAHRLVTALGIDPAEGTVRVSLVHYNTPDEIERAIAALATVV